MQSSNPMGGMNGVSLQDMQRLQQQMQQQQFLPQQAQQQMMGMSAFAGMNPQQLAALQQQRSQLNSNPALALMQQQQQQQQQQANAASSDPMLSANNQNALLAATNWNGARPGINTMDASTGSSARLMAMSGMGASGLMGATAGAGNHGMSSKSAAGMNNSSKLTGGPSAVGGGMGGPLSLASNSKMQNMQILLQHQKTQQQGGGTGPGGTTAATPQQLLFQRQFASLQQQHQAALQQRGLPGGGVAQQQPQDTNALMQAQQQHLFQQMQLQQQQGNAAALMQQQQGSNNNNSAMGIVQQQQGGSNNNNSAMGVMQQQQGGNNSSAMGIMQQQQGGNNNVMGFMQQQQGGSNNNVMGIMQQMAQPQQPQFNSSGQQLQQAANSTGVVMDEQSLRMHQQSLLRPSMRGTNPGGSSSELSGHHSSTTSHQHSSSLSFQQLPPLQLQQQPQFHQQQQHAIMHQDGVSSNHHSTTNHFAALSSNSNQVMSDDSSMNSLSQRSATSVPTNTSSAASNMNGEQQQKTFLDGSFAGGWQSNDDLPDRRQVIFLILEVIRQMRPDANSVPASRFPHLAKTLEEHLYRSASTKDEYMNVSTLRQRLQSVAQHLEFHRAGPSPPTTFPQQPQPLLSPQLSQGGNIGGLGGSFAVNTMDAAHAMNAENWSATAGVNNMQMSSSSMNSSSQGTNGGSSLHQSFNMRQSDGGGVQENVLWQNDANVAEAQISGGTQAFAGQHADNSLQNAMTQLTQGHQQQQGNVYSGSSMMPSQELQQQQQQHNVSQGGWQNIAPAFQQSNSNSVVPAVTQDPASAQKKRVIMQQQQRLLLLRHASKCTAGPECNTKFCSQMVTLWMHMKACRDKNCKTSHCLSSRCVLNHYRICKSNGRTSSCEVCGPVMNRIKQLERDDGLGDPLTKDSDTPPPDSMQMSAQMTSSSNNVDVSSDEAQLQQVQAQQMRLKAQLDSLKQLQKRQEELLKQQRRLEMAGRQVQDPASPQAQQLRQQQMLLQNLQKKCQQQQLLLQQEVQMQMSLESVTQSLVPSASIPEAPVAAPSSSMGGGGEKKTRRISQSKKQQKVVKPVRLGKGKSLALGTIIESPPQKRENVQSKSIIHEQVESPPLFSPVPTSNMKFQTAVQKSTGDNPTLSFEPENTSLIPFMTKKSIQNHLDSLNKQIRLSSRTVTHKCLPLLQALIEDPFGWVFNDAVDPVALGLPDYFDVVKTPMHLDLVRKKLENAIYSDLEVFARDVRLVFDNSILYNGDASEVGQLAQSLLTKFNDSYATLVQEVESSHRNLEKNGEICSLCGIQNRKFEPAVLYCQGECKMQRINRGAMYFTDRTKQNHWCESCFSLLKPEESIMLDDGSEITKSDLQGLKNDALPEEGWVNCDECNSWVHQVCGLFNGRTNKSTVRYTCPSCFVKRNDQATLAMNKKLVKGAADLPHCKMSEAIELGLYRALEQAYKDRASELGISSDEVERAEGLTVRVIANAEKKHLVGEKMFGRYSGNGCLSEFPVRAKCIALFQEIHGVDILLFAVYVYEYGQECGAPNRRRVYISYMDSVQYFEPKCYRTTAYHAILLEYLRYVKLRGFHTAHIWSCPPTAGDDYIFYCHPSHQLVPREDMLRAWYHRLFDRAKAEGVVLRTTTLYDEYFVKDGIDSVSWPASDPTCLPYFEGDYIPGEIENIIRLEEGGLPKPTNSCIDSIMARLGHNLNKMKENFIVVHLRSRRFAAAVHRGEDVSQWKEDCDEEVVRRKRAKISGKDSSELRHGTDYQGFLGTVSATFTADGTECGPIVEGVKSEVPISVSTEPDVKATNFGSDSTMQQIDSYERNVFPMETGETTQVEIKEECLSAGIGAVGSSSALISKQSFGDIEPLIRRPFEGLKRSGAYVCDTYDEDEPIEMELFESRQRFLNYSQSAHCQFDELRRAKHSTMMLLFQLHNPTAPLFLQQCGACYRDIVHGIRYHCNDCSNFDLCEECYEPVTSGRLTKRDPRFAHDNAHTFLPIDMEAAEKASKKERQESLQAHVALLEHAGTCKGPPGCSSQNCQRMKKLFAHVASCQVKPKTDCRICTRLLSLCAVHSRKCTIQGSCPVPFCDRIRERNMRLRRQQQLMDDRRRQAQNDLYHATEA